MTQNEKKKKSEFYTGFLAFLYLPFLAALFYLTVSGAYLTLHPALDFYHYFVMKLHIFCGFFIFWTFFPVSFMHLKKLYHGSLLRITFLSSACFYILLIFQIWPQAAFSASALLLFYLSVLYMRDDRTSGKFSILSGIVAWVFFNLVIATGMVVGGPMKTFRTDAYNTLHEIFGLSCIPVVFYHLLIRLPSRLNKKTLFASFTVISFTALLLSHAFKQAEMHTKKTQKQSRALSSAYAASPKADALQKIGGAYSMKNPATCGKSGCHTEIYKEWKVSAHRFSAANMPYQKVFGRFKKENGEHLGVFCERCHNPDVVTFNEVSRDKNAHAFFTNNGVSCLSCHLISDVDAAHGDGIYKTKIDAPYLPGFAPSSRADWQILHHFIRSDLRLHRKNYKRALHRKSEFCVSCHRLTIPSSLNHAKPVFLSGPFGSYEKSSFRAAGIVCQNCHLPLFEFHDPESIDTSFHARPDHRMLGIAAALPSVVPSHLATQNAFLDFQKSVQHFLSGKLAISYYEQVFMYATRDPGHAAYTQFLHGKSALKINMEASFSRHNTRNMRLSVKTTNQSIGHDFPAGLLDLIEVWLEVTVKDAKGKTVFQSGFLNNDSSVDKNARRLGGEEYDVYGNRILDHSIWRLASFKNVRVIAPQKSVKDTYSIMLTKNFDFPITISARWLYRRYNPAFMKSLYGKNLPSIPVVELGSAKKTISQR